MITVIFLDTCGSSFESGRATEKCFFIRKTAVLAEWYVGTLPLSLPEDWRNLFGLHIYLIFLSWGTLRQFLSTACCFKVIHWSICLLLRSLRASVCVLSCSDASTLCNPVGCSLPGSSVHGIFQSRMLEWIAISFFRGSSWPRDQTRVSWVSCIGRWILYHRAAWEVLRSFNVKCLPSTHSFQSLFWALNMQQWSQQALPLWSLHFGLWSATGRAGTLGTSNTA